MPQHIFENQNQDRHLDQPTYHSRSRNKNNRNKKKKGKIYSQSNHRQIYNLSQKRNSRKQFKRSIYGCKEKIMRMASLVEVSPPTSFLISQHPTYIDKNQPKFRLNLVTDSKPPSKIKTIVDQLKDKITPISKIWTSYIKQFLNDSEFVQIYRKGKSLEYGEIQYGKTIINYSEYCNTQRQNLSQSKIFSRAYFKIWEILSMGIFEGKQTENIKIASLAEGPGGFIHALIDYRQRNGKQRDQIYAITLKMNENTRNAKDWSDFRAKSFFDEMLTTGHKISLSYGQTGTGNLLQLQNIISFAQVDLNGEKCYLVTGDGGIECISDEQYHYQQVFNSKLFYSQIITALKIQQIGGKFILKIYDCSFQLTKQLISLLCTFYQSVKIVKPVTSRPGNSQKYLISEGFIGLKREQQVILQQILQKLNQIQPNINYFENSKFITNIFDYNSIKNHEQIIKNIQKANNYFLEQQKAKLQEGFQLAEETCNNQKQIEQLLKNKRYSQQISYSYSWCKKYGLPTIQATLQESLGKQQNCDSQLK